MWSLSFNFFTCPMPLPLMLGKGICQSVSPCLCKQPLAFCWLLTFVGLVKYFLNADFSLKIISITRSAASPSASPRPRGRNETPDESQVQDRDWGQDQDQEQEQVQCWFVAFLFAVFVVIWQLVPPLQLSLSSAVARPAASRLNATTLFVWLPRTANRQTWSIIFNGEHKLLMQQPVKAIRGSWRRTGRGVELELALAYMVYTELINLKTMSRQWPGRATTKVFIKLVKWARSCSCNPEWGWAKMWHGWACGWGCHSI